MEIRLPTRYKELEVLDDKEREEEKQRRKHDVQAVWEEETKQRKLQQQLLMDQQDDELFHFRGDDVYRVLMKGIRLKTLRRVFQGQETAIEELTQDSSAVKQELVPMEASQSKQREDLKKLSSRLEALENRQEGVHANDQGQRR